MKKSKEFIEGYCQSLIDTNENIDSNLEVKAIVYYVDLTDSYSVHIVWRWGYDNYDKKYMFGINTFSLNDLNLKDFGFELVNFLDDELSKIKFDNEYNSKTAKLDFQADDL